LKKTGDEERRDAGVGRRFIQVGAMVDKVPGAVDVAVETGHEERCDASVTRGYVYGGMVVDE